MGVGWWRVGNHQLRNCSTSWEGAKLSDEGKLCRAFHFIARALNEILTKEIHELNQFDFVWFLYFSDFISSPPQSGAAGETGRSKTKWAKMWNSSTSKFVRKIFLKKQIKAYKQIILKNYPHHANIFLSKKFYQQILWTVRKRGKHSRPGAKIWNGVKSIVGVAALRREWETHKTTSPRCIVMTFTLLYHWSHEEKTQIITITTTKPTYYRNHLWPPIVVHHHSFSSTFIFVL